MPKRRGKQKAQESPGAASAAIDGSGSHAESAPVRSQRVLFEAQELLSHIMRAQRAGEAEVIEQIEALSAFFRARFAEIHTESAFQEVLDAFVLIAERAELQFLRVHQDLYFYPSLIDREFSFQIVLILSLIHSAGDLWPCAVRYGDDHKQNQNLFLRFFEGLVHQLVNHYLEKLNRFYAGDISLAELSDEIDTHFEIIDRVEGMIKKSRCETVMANFLKLLMGNLKMKLLDSAFLIADKCQDTLLQRQFLAQRKRLLTEYKQVMSTLESQSLATVFTECELSLIQDVDKTLVTFKDLFSHIEAESRFSVSYDERLRSLLDKKVLGRSFFSDPHLLFVKEQIVARQILAKRFCLASDSSLLVQKLGRANSLVSSGDVTGAKPLYAQVADDFILIVAGLPKNDKAQHMIGFDEVAPLWSFLYSLISFSFSQLHTVERSRLSDLIDCYHKIGPSIYLLLKAYIYIRIDAGLESDVKVRGETLVVVTQICTGNIKSFHRSLSALHELITAPVPVVESPSAREEVEAMLTDLQRLLNRHMHSFLYPTLREKIGLIRIESEVKRVLSQVGFLDLQISFFYSICLAYDDMSVRYNRFARAMPDFIRQQLTRQAEFRLVLIRVGKFLLDRVLFQSSRTLSIDCRLLFSSLIKLAGSLHEHVGDLYYYDADPARRSERLALAIKYCDAVDYAMCQLPTGIVPKEIEVLWVTMGAVNSKNRHSLSRMFAAETPELACQEGLAMLLDRGMLAADQGKVWVVPPILDRVLEFVSDGLNRMIRERVLLDEQVLMCFLLSTRQVVHYALFAMESCNFVQIYRGILPLIVKAKELQTLLALPIEAQAMAESQKLINMAFLKYNVLLDSHKIPLSFDSERICLAEMVRHFQVMDKRSHAQLTSEILSEFQRIIESRREFCQQWERLFSPLVSLIDGHIERGISLQVLFSVISTTLFNELDACLIPLGHFPFKMPEPILAQQAFQTYFLKQMLSMLCGLFRQYQNIDAEINVKILQSIQKYYPILVDLTIAKLYQYVDCEGQPIREFQSFVSSGQQLLGEVVEIALLPEHEMTPLLLDEIHQHQIYFYRIALLVIAARARLGDEAAVPCCEAMTEQLRQFCDDDAASADLWRHQLDQYAADMLCLRRTSVRENPAFVFYLDLQKGWAEGKKARVLRRIPELIAMLTAQVPLQTKDGGSVPLSQWLYYVYGIIVRDLFFLLLNQSVGCESYLQSSLQRAREALFPLLTREGSIYLELTEQDKTGQLVLLISKEMQTISALLNRVIDLASQGERRQRDSRQIERHGLRSLGRVIVTTLVSRPVSDDLEQMIAVAEEYQVGLCGLPKGSGALFNKNSEEYIMIDNVVSFLQFLVGKLAIKEWYALACQLIAPAAEAVAKVDDAALIARFEAIRAQVEASAAQESEAASTSPADGEPSATHDLVGDAARAEHKREKRRVQKQRKKEEKRANARIAAEVAEAERAEQARSAAEVAEAERAEQARSAVKAIVSELLKRAEEAIAHDEEKSARVDFIERSLEENRVGAETEFGARFSGVIYGLEKAEGLFATIDRVSARTDLVNFTKLLAKLERTCIHYLETKLPDLRRFLAEKRDYFDEQTLGRFQIMDDKFAPLQNRVEQLLSKVKAIKLPMVGGEEKAEEGVLSDVAEGEGVVVEAGVPVRRKASFGSDLSDTSTASISSGTTLSVESDGLPLERQIRADIVSAIESFFLANSQVAAYIRQHNLCLTGAAIADIYFVWKYCPPENHQVMWRYLIADLDCVAPKGLSLESIQAESAGAELIPSQTGPVVLKVMVGDAIPYEIEIQALTDGDEFEDVIDKTDLQLSGVGYHAGRLFSKRGFGDILHGTVSTMIEESEPLGASMRDDPVKWLRLMRKIGKQVIYQRIAAKEAFVAYYRLSPALCSVIETWPAAEAIEKKGYRLGWIVGRLLKFFGEMDALLYFQCANNHNLLEKFFSLISLEEGYDSLLNSLQTIFCDARYKMSTAAGLGYMDACFDLILKKQRLIADLLLKMHLLGTDKKQLFSFISVAAGQIVCQKEHSNHVADFHDKREVMMTEIRALVAHYDEELAKALVPRVTTPVLFRSAPPSDSSAAAAPDPDSAVIIRPNVVPI